MSIVENIANHEEELLAQMDKMQASMQASETGKRVMEKSVEMSTSEEMMRLMELIGNPEIPEKERVLLAQYMGQMMKDDPKDGLNKYAQYLDGVAADPKYAVRKDYYVEIRDASIAVNASAIYQDYIAAYQEFEADNSEEAQTARKHMDDLQNNMKQWAGNEG